MCRGNSSLGEREKSPKEARSYSKRMKAEVEVGREGGGKSEERKRGLLSCKGPSALRAPSGFPDPT